MSTSGLPSPISDTLRCAIAESGMSYKTLSRATGVARASIQRFVDGRQSLRLDMADRLATFYDLRLVPATKITRRKSES
jgi:plasmid maintenance system antidote protein VapI